MTPDRWISLITSLSGLGAAFAALFTLLEMRRQRRSQNLVTFVIPEFQWTVEMTGDFTTFETSIGDRKIESQFPSGEIINLGRAPATAVSVKSSYRLSEIQGFLGSYRDNRQFNVSDKSGLFVLIKTSGGQLMVNRELDGVTSIDFVSPTSSAAVARATFKFPLLYVTLFEEYLRLLWEMLESQSKASLQEEARGLFAVTLAIEYKDIEGRNHIDRFAGEPRFVVLSEKQANGTWSFTKHT